MTDQDSGATENYSQAVSTRLTRETKDRYDRFRDEHDLGNAQALRRLVRVALEQEQTDTRLDERATARNISGVFAVGGGALAVSGYADAVGILLSVHLAVIWLWSIWPYIEPYVQAATGWGDRAETGE